MKSITLFRIQRFYSTAMKKNQEYGKLYKVVEKEDSLIVVGLIDTEMMRASIKVELLKTLKKRQKYVQDK